MIEMEGEQFKVTDSVKDDTTAGENDEGKSRLLVFRHFLSEQAKYIFLVLPDLVT